MSTAPVPSSPGRPRSQPLSPGTFADGGIRLFAFAGITVRLHWTWFFVAAWLISDPPVAYGNHLWNAAEYLALFGMVLLHEFGHALACRSVGGRAEKIMLWPLGGVAYVQPPPRPWPLLWSIIAGPLVNLVLVVPLLAAYIAFGPVEFLSPATDLEQFVASLNFINFILLAFNLLPVYPLDGGQILRGLLWLVCGRGWSLLIAAGLGIVAAVAGGAWALSAGSLWLAVLAGFGAYASWAGIRQGQALRALDRIPRHRHLRCHGCGEPPLAGPVYTCSNCGQSFDAFTVGYACNCGSPVGSIPCIFCGRREPAPAWAQPAAR